MIQSGHNFVKATTPELLWYLTWFDHYVTNQIPNKNNVDEISNVNS